MAVCTRIELVPLAWQASVVATRLTDHKQDAFVYTCTLPTELINQLMVVDIGIEPMTSSFLKQNLLNGVLYILNFNYQLIGDPGGIWTHDITVKG